MQAQTQAIRSAWAVAVVLIAIGLAGCGGGGSGSGNGTGVSRSGLMPAAPLPGEALFEDAAVLRPVRAGATYRYRGTRNDEASITSYTNEVEHGGTGDQVVETSSNLFDAGEDISAFQVDRSAVVLTTALDVTGDGRAEVSRMDMLRSPVRKNEQYNLADLHLPGGIEDVDGDGQPDTADMALYRRVVGMEDVELGGLPTQRALRVDMVVLLRVTGSADGRTSPVSTITQSTWYAPGVGIVRQRLDSPIAGLPTRLVHDERLTGWNDAVRGFGYSTPRALTASIGSTATGLPQAPTWNHSRPLVAALSDRALVVTGSVSNPDSFGIGVVDAQGRMVRHLTYPGDDSLQTALMTPFGNGALLVGEGRYGELSVMAFDANAASTTPWPPAHLNLNPPDTDLGAVSLGLAATAGRGWILYRRASPAGSGGATSSFDLLLRSIGLPGQWAGPELLLARGIIPSARIAASGERVLVSWEDTDAQATTHRKLAWLSAAQATPVISTLAGPIAAPTDSGIHFWDFHLVGADGDFAALWDCAFVSASCDAVRGVRIDAQGRVLRTTTGPVDDEVLPELWPASTRDTVFQFNPVVAMGFGDLVSVEPSREILGPDVSDSYWITVRWLALGQGPLAGAATGTRTIRLPAGNGETAAAATAVLSDRIIVFSTEQGLHSTVVWKP